MAVPARTEKSALLRRFHASQKSRRLKPWLASRARERSWDGRILWIQEV